MNTKIIISLFLLISAHNSFCMLINPSQTKHVQKICTTQQTNQKAADTYLKPFMLRSLLDNAEMFNKQRRTVKHAIINQCKENNKISPIISLMLLPIEDQFKIISYFFEDKCRLAAEYFISIPLEKALEKYNALPNNNLTLLRTKHNLTQGMIFRSTRIEQRILTKIFTNDIIARQKLTILKKSPKDILQKILEQNPDITMLENENKLLVFLTTPYWATNPNYPLALRINTTIMAILGTPILMAPIFGIKIIGKFMYSASATIHSFLQFSAYIIHQYPRFSNYYETETSKTITKPLQSLL